MNYRHILVCDDCGLEVENDPDDGQPDDWGINVDGDDVCPKCATKLDPYDPEMDDTLTDQQRHVALNPDKHPLPGFRCDGCFKD